MEHNYSQILEIGQVMEDAIQQYLNLIPRNVPVMRENISFQCASPEKANKKLIEDGFW